VDDVDAARLRVGQAPFGRCEVMTWEAFEQRSNGVPLPSMTGTFERDGDALIFTPRFLFTEGARYALIVDGELVASLVRPVTPPPAPTAVTGIFPTGGSVPVNLLRIYVHFSAPMSEGFAARAVTISDARTGAPLPATLLDMTPELWDPARTRLTLLLDPGRIKRGLVPHMEGGYPLAEGRTVVIAVDAAFKDAAGQPLAEGFSRRYDVVPALAGRVDPGQWTMSRPAAGSFQALQIAFDRPLDRALLARCVAVQDADGAAIDGEIHIAAGERAWSFRPRQPWAGACAVAVDTRLEDVAGNSVVRVFDRDLTSREDDPAGDHRVELLPVEIKLVASN
jgi:hypothetical protein